MSSAEEKKTAVDHSLEVLRKQLAEIDEELDLDSESASYKPHLIRKRNEILTAIESGEKLKRILHDARG